MEAEEETLNTEHIRLLEDRDGTTIQASYGSNNPVYKYYTPKNNLYRNI